LNKETMKISLKITQMEHMLVSVRNKPKLRSKLFIKKVLMMKNY